MLNYDVSTLFSSLNTKNNIMNFDFGQYASLKNGSYQKLTKAYYAKQAKESSESKNTSEDKTKEAAASKKDNTDKLTSEALLGDITDKKATTYSENGTKVTPGKSTFSDYV